MSRLKAAIILPICWANFLFFIPIATAADRHLQPPTRRTEIGQYFTNQDSYFLNLLTETVSQSRISNSSKQVIYSLVQSNPRTVIQVGKSVCYDLRQGSTLESIISSQANIIIRGNSEFIDPVAMMEAIAAIDGVAVAYYCPEYLRQLTRYR
jgi:hypothetical protein